jgi:preprotein translocase subunit YajC
MIPNPTAVHALLASIAQQGPSLPGAPSAPAAGGAPSATDAGAAPGAPAAATQQTGAAGGRDLLIMMAVMVGALFLFTWMSQRRERKKRDQLLSGIKRHDKVMTIGGIIGSVVELKDDAVVLKVDETSNTRITFSKSAISQVIAQAAAE